jgi:hypothetical protein
LGERRELRPRTRLFRRFRRYRFLKGYDLLWGNLRYVRDITFDAALPVTIGAMSNGLWWTSIADTATARTAMGLDTRHRHRLALLAVARPCAERTVSVPGG